MNTFVECQLCEPIHKSWLAAAVWDRQIINAEMQINIIPSENKI